MVNNEQKETKYPDNLLAAIGTMRVSEWFEEIYSADFELVNPESLTVPADFRASLEYVLWTLTERERGIIKYRFEDGLNLEDTAKKYGVTRERIRQIEAKALRKLKRPTRQQYIRKGVAAIIEEVAERKAKAMCSKLRAEAYQEGYNACRTEWLMSINKVEQEQPEPKDETAKRAILPQPIEMLDLSVRSYNCLKRAGVNTIEQLSELSQHRLYRIRNLGQRSVDEIVKVMEGYGFQIPERNVGDDR